MNTAEMIERLKKAANVNEDQALAEIFGMSKASFSYAKKNSSFSVALMSDFASRYDCDLHWVITGEGREPQLDTSQRMLLTAFDDLDDAQKMQAVVFVGNLAKAEATPTAQPAVSVNQSHNINTAIGEVVIKK